MILKYKNGNNYQILADCNNNLLIHDGLAV